MSTPEPTKRQLEQLKTLFESEDGNIMYDRITDFIPGIVYIYDSNKKKLRYINKRVTEILGYSFDDINTWDDDWTKLIFDEDKELVSTELQKYYGLKDDESHSYQSRLNHKEGNWRYFKTQGTVLRRGQDGSAESILFIAQDITDQLKTAEENKKLLEVLEETQIMLDFGVWTLDLKTMLADCSSGFLRLLDYNTSDNSKLTIDEYSAHIPSPDKEHVLSAISNAIQNSTEFEIEHALISNHREKKIVLCKGKIVLNEKGDAIKLVGSIMNVTKVRNAEYALGNKIDDLNRSNKDLEDFAYIASHDLQEPLRKISTFGQRLAKKFKTVLDEEAEAYLTRMMTSTETMRQLIDNLLEYSRVTRHMQGFEKVDLNIVLKTVINELDLVIEETSTTINPALLPTILGMNLQVKQLFINLITNAIKFRQKHQPCIINITSSVLTTDECITHGLTLNKQYFKICFADNGIGFEEEYAEKIFVIFQRLHGKADYPGSGIGLSICRKIVDNHQGHMYALGILNVGATFNIILPQ
jgi:PAS domain S-box-containing protein